MPRDWHEDRVIHERIMGACGHRRWSTLRSEGRRRRRGLDYEWVEIEIQCAACPRKATWRDTNDPYDVREVPDDDDRYLAPEKPRALREPTNAELDERLCAAIPYYTTNEITVKGTVFRRLAALGWNPRVVSKNKAQGCVLEKSGRRFESPQFSDATAAIVSATRMLLASGCRI